MDWFAVRHVIENDGSFEERITLWETASEDEAIARAEEEARAYVSALGDPMKILGLFQSYRLSDPPRQGCEVFSLIRRSPLPSEDYLATFFDTGDELQRTE